MLRTDTALQVGFLRFRLGTLLILCDRFERNQYLEIRELWNAGTGEWAGKGAGDTYGAEHFCRLLGKSI